MKSDDQVRQYRSNVVGTSVRMGIAEGAEAHITGILTKMYSDPELACVREYSTNARDSHIEAGQERPIEVTLPTPYLPMLTIRDYGTGLDEQGITELYSQYGASSKRDTNSAQGMLGIGCKSALAYTDQFTVVGYRHGVKTQVVVSRDEDGAATQTIVGVDTGQFEDGVEVTIPAKADNDIVQKARDFFRFWPKGSVVFKTGEALEEPRPIGSEAVEDDGEGGEYRNIWLDDSTLLTNEVDQDLVVMGYVAYPLVDGDDDLFTSPQGGRRYDPQRGYVYGKAYNAVCFVDIGEVNFAPSRESLMTTKRTKDKLIELRKHVADTFDASVRSQIAAANNAKEAQDLLVAGRNMGFDDGANPAQWQGRDVLLKLIRGKPTVDYNGDKVLSTQGCDSWETDDCLLYSYLFANTNSYSRKQGERGGNLDLKLDGLTIFTGFDGKWLTNVKRAKLELWGSKKGVTIDKAVFLNKLNETEKFWTSGWTIYDWAEVEATELPKTTTTDGSVVRLKGSYDAIVNDQAVAGLAAHKIDTTKPLYYCHGNQWTAGVNHAVKSGAVSLQGATLVALSQNRIEKFKRDFPMAVEVSDAARKAAKEWASKIGHDQVKANAVQNHRAYLTLQTLKGEDFEDAALNTLIRLANTNVSAYRAGLEKFKHYVESQDAIAIHKLIEGITKKYPLMDWSSYAKPGGKYLEHAILYLKAVIAEKE